MTSGDVKTPDHEPRKSRDGHAQLGGRWRVKRGPENGIARGTVLTNLPREAIGLERNKVGPARLISQQFGAKIVFCHPPSKAGS